MTVRGMPLPLALAVSVATALACTTARAQPPTQPYQDRIIAPESLQPLPTDEDEAVDSDGLPRSLRIEFNHSQAERGSESFDEQGLAANGFWETATLGNFSLDATVFRSDRERFRDNDGIGGSATLWQRYLHLDGGWRVDNGLGVLNTPSLPLQRKQYRFYLPTVPFAGISSDWTQASSKLQLQGAFGRAGIYSGTRVVGFDVADGEVGALGAQWSWSPRWTGTAAFLGTHGRIVPDDLGEAVLASGDTQALHSAVDWQGGRDSVQLNLLASDGDLGQASGAWIDASARRGRYSHNYGAFRLEPGLAWGALPINNDVEGGYYRLGYQYGRWLWNAGIDTLQSISGNGFDGQYATGYARYQANSTLGYGGSLSVRRAPNLSHGAQLFADKRTRWGQTRVQLDQASGGGGDSWQVGLDQAFDLRQGSRLSASIAYGALAHAGEASTNTTTLAFNGGRDLSDRLSFDGTARWTHASGPDAQRGVDLNLAVNWRISPHWGLATTLYQSEGSRRSPFILDPLVTETPFISIPRERSLFLTLRYERQAGRPLAVIGGAPGAATGSVEGSLYLDDNGDGVRAASELPAINVTVVLDGRYSVRSDSAGNFEFPRVAVGPHTLSVVSDNLPLPWSFDEAAAQRVVPVTVRQAARVDIGARRPR